MLVRDIRLRHRMIGRCDLVQEGGPRVRRLHNADVIPRRPYQDHLTGNRTYGYSDRTDSAIGRDRVEECSDGDTDGRSEKMQQGSEPRASEASTFVKQAGARPFIWLLVPPLLALIRRRPKSRWVADITYVAPWSGVLCVAWCKRAWNRLEVC